MKRLKAKKKKKKKKKNEKDARRTKRKRNKPRRDVAANILKDVDWVGRGGALDTRTPDPSHRRLFSGEMDGDAKEKNLRALVGALERADADQALSCCCCQPSQPLSPLSIINIV